MIDVKKLGANWDEESMYKYMCVFACTQRKSGSCHVIQLFLLQFVFKNKNLCMQNFIKIVK